LPPRGGVQALGLGADADDRRSVETQRSVRPPVLFVQGELRRFVESKRLRPHVSVTDERSMAMAYVVAEPGNFECVGIVVGVEAGNCLRPTVSGLLHPRVAW
jgi:hypothetical protein